MIGIKQRILRPGMSRFAREVTASLLATGIASVAFTHLSHEPTSRAPAVTSSGKSAERIPAGRAASGPDWTQESVPTRETRIYDTVAMFALPVATDWSWSDVAPATSVQAASVDVPPPARKPGAGRLAQAAGRPSTPSAGPSSAVPPARPAEVAPVLADAGEPADTPHPRGVHVLGWMLPGSDRLPTGRETLKHMASLGGQVVALGADVAGTVGLR